MLLDRRLLAALGGVAGLLLAWAAVATWYVLSRDEVAQILFVRQAELRYGYEDRIAELKRRLEHEITRGLVERNGMGARAETLAARQREVEARQVWLSGLVERLGGPAGKTGQPLPPLQAPAAPAEREPALGPTRKPAPLSEALGLRRAFHAAEETRPDRDGPLDRLSALEQSLARASGEVFRLTEAVQGLSSERSARIRAALDATRVEIGRFHPAQASEAASGGPFVPSARGFDAGPFGLAAAAAETRLAELETLLAAGRALPLGRPVGDETETTSGFGYRLDPFTRAPALHTGLDFRADSGSPVRAAGAGTVLAAEYAAGYGNMVEIDHGGGVTTRYGHLSRFAVAPGVRVGAGQLIGRVGSTGRSTGAHLHYETRIDGEPVDPARFLHAGRLMPILPTLP